MSPVSLQMLGMKSQSFCFALGITEKWGFGNALDPVASGGLFGDQVGLEAPLGMSPWCFCAGV